MIKEEDMFPVSVQPVPAGIPPPPGLETQLIVLPKLSKVTCEVDLGVLTPNEIEVEIYYGLVKSIDTLTSSDTEVMDVLEDRGNGKYLYGCTLTCRISGRYGFTARIIPRGDDWIRFVPGLISWA